MGNTFGAVNYCQRYPQFCASVEATAGAFPATTFDQQSNNMQAAQPMQQQHSPLGSLAAFKGKRLDKTNRHLNAHKNMFHFSPLGDMISPVFNIGFFVAGVIVVVKVLMALIAMIKSKLGMGLASHHLNSSGEHLQMLLDRRRKRSAGSNEEPEPIVESNQHLDGLTAVVMSALESQQCLQRMSCELGSLVRQYDTVNIVDGSVSKISFA